VELPSIGVQASSSALLAHARLRGPIVVVGRPHSGTRILARMLADHGVFVGATTRGFLDSLSWCTRFVVPLVASRFFPCFPEPGEDAAFDRFVAARLDDALARFFAHGVPPAGTPWGWKYPETLFVMPILERLLPGARFVHLVRDGRDVCLSDGGYFQVTGDHRDPPGWDLPSLGEAARSRAEPGARATYRDFCWAVAFGDASVRCFEGIDLEDRIALGEHRFTLQMQSWLHCVHAARAHGRASSADDYLEVRYEDLCARPAELMASILAWLGLPLRPAAQAALAHDVGSARVGKWRTVRLSRAQSRDFARAVALGEPLLRELGYPL
jgi:hypothetical protein